MAEQDMCFFVKVKPPESAKAWWFLAPKGTLTRLRIRAAIFKRRADADKLLAVINKDNPGWQAKIVEWK